jgi:RNA polymerase sigma factor (sigma-70 family)
MVAVLVKSEKPDSELVIGQNPKTPYTTEETEQTLIQRVKDRAALHQQKPDRRDFSTEEHWLDRRGDRALTQLLNLHNRRICSLVAKNQNGMGSADVDLKQEAVAAFIEAIYRYDPSKGAALFSYAYFWILDRLQQISGQNNRNAIATGKALAEGEGYDYPDLKDVYQHEDLSVAVSLLPEHQQRVIWLRQAEVSFAAIAEKIGLAVKTVEGLYYAGIKKLRSFLDGALSCVLTARKQMIAVLAQTTQIEAAAIESSADAKPVAEPTSVEDSIPEAKPAKGFKILRGLFKKEPITNLEPTVRPEFFQYSVNLDPLIIQSEERHMHYATKSAQHKNLLPRWFALLPPAWIMGAIATVAVGISGDPILLPLLVATWATMLLVAGAARYFQVKTIQQDGILRLTLNAGLWNRHRRNYFTITGGVALIVGLAATHELTFAAAAAAGGGCSNLGFLNPLGTFATSVFQGLVTTGGSGGNVTDAICTFIGWILLATVIGGVFGIGTVSVQLISSPGNFGTSVFSLLGAVFFVLGCLALFALVGI